MTEPLEHLRAQLNGETGKLTWKELERYFAHGVVIRVAHGLDLVDVAACFARDDKDSVAAWIHDGLIARASAEEALDWHQRQATFWAVVLAPWVLVQDDSAALNS